MIQVYHNPDCSKSNACLLFLGEAGAAYEVIDYQAKPPTVDDLRGLIAKLGIEPIGLVRQNEPIWTERFADRLMSNDEILEAMAENPILIQRPIVINGEKAIIARPLELAATII